MTHTPLSKGGNITMLVLRILVGGLFVFAGGFKVLNMSLMVSMFGAMGIPAFLTYIVGYGELVGGIFLLLGLWTCITSVFLGIIMVFAVYFSWPLGLASAAFPFVTFLLLMVILKFSSGKYAIKGR